MSERMTGTGAAQIRLDDAVEAITQGVLRALEARQSAQSATTSTQQAAGLNPQPLPPRVRIIAGGILDVPAPELM